MTKQPGISLGELQRLQQSESRRKFTAEHERKYALELLANLSHLDQKERGRVVRRALKINAA